MDRSEGNWLERNLGILELLASRFLVSLNPCFLRFLCLFAAISSSLLVLTVSQRPICHGRAQPVLIVPGVDGVLGAAGVDMDIHC